MYLCTVESRVRNLLFFFSGSLFIHSFACFLFLVPTKKVIILMTHQKDVMNQTSMTSDKKAACHL